MTSAEEYWARMEIFDAGHNMTDRQILEDYAVNSWVNPNLPTRRLIFELIQAEIELHLYFRQDKGYDPEEHF